MKSQLTKYSQIKTILFLFLINTFSIYSQQLNSSKTEIPQSITISTPDVMSFHKYGNSSINKYSGKINLSVPLYEINSGKIKIPINLTYNSGGVKVEEIASSVGLGWNLNGEGNILKTIKDVEDFTLRTSSISSFYQFRTDVGNAFRGLLYDDNLIVSQPKHNEYAYNLDSSPDFYYIKAPGLSNVFYIDTRDPLTHNKFYDPDEYKVVLLKPNGVKFHGLEDFTPVDFEAIGFTGEEDGNSDKSFSVRNTDKITQRKEEFFKFSNAQGLEYSFSSGTLLESRSIPVLKKLEKWMYDNSYNVSLSTYDLNEIYDREFNKKVEYVHERYTIDKPDFFKSSSKESGESTDECNYEYVHSFDDTKRYTNGTLIKYHATRLTKIKFDKGVVEFLYLNDREDYSGKSLDEVIVKNLEGEIVKHFRFNYTYFYSKENCSDEQCKRLKLSSIDQVNNSISKMYFTFDYSNPNQLPRRNSYEQDFLGYYNNNGYTNQSLSFNSEESGPQPELFFYPNQAESSILPIAKKNSVGKKIDGDYSLEPNSSSLYGLLNKVTYETGGYTQYEYQNHTYNFDGEEYIGGGARIKAQTSVDNNGGSERIEYFYEETDGGSSGYINNFPVFGYPESQILNLDSSPSQWSPFNFTTFDFDKSSLNLTENFVGYSRVLEIESGNGSTETIFNSPKNFPNNKATRVYGDDCAQFLVENSAFPGGLIYEDLSTRRGQLKKEIVKNESGNTILERENFYENEIFSTIDIKNHEPYDIPYVHETVYHPEGTVEDVEFTLRGGNPDDYVSEYSKINIERNLLIKTEIKEFFNNVEPVITTTDYKYDSDYPFVKEIKISDSNSKLTTNLYYPFDSEVLSLPHMSTLVDQNRISEPIIQIFEKDDIQISKSQLNFDSYNSGVLSKSSSISKGNNPLEEGNIINLRDNQGNILEVENSKSGIKTSYVWGYNKQYPIAKIENASYSGVKFYLNLTSVNNLTNLNNGYSIIYTPFPVVHYLTDSETRDLLNKVRLYYNNALVTTYTYEPLVGITSITDPKGYTTYYEYDDFNRLEQVKDADGKILSKNEYHYKGQQ